MRRLLPLVVVLLALAALPAAASDAHSFRGTLTALSPTALSIKGKQGVTVTCRIRHGSPSVDGYAVGDSVQAACAGRPHRLVLVRLRKAPAPPVVGDTKPVTFAGAVTSLSGDAVSLHDGDRDLTCKLGPSSPALSGVAVGDHIRVACADGVLTAWQRVTPPHLPAPAPPVPAPTEPSAPAPGTALTAGGAITVLGPDVITLSNDEHGDVSCGIGPSSPPLGDFHVGDRVGIACVDGVLAKIVRLSPK